MMSNTTLTIQCTLVYSTADLLTKYLNRPTGLFAKKFRSGSRFALTASAARGIAAHHETTPITLSVNNWMFVLEC